MTGLEQKRTGQRAGFTLVELLVVVGVILVLMTLVVAFVPRTMEQQRVSRAASSLQGWLSLAKQWALRDQAPRGLRFTYDSTNRITTLNYVEQPDDWTASPGSTISSPGTAVSWVGGTAPYTGISMTGSTFTLTTFGADFSGGAGGASVTYSPTAGWPVQGGDYLEVGSGSTSQLGKIIYDPLANPSITLLGNQVTVNVNMGNVKTSNFRVVRAPRVRTGEAPLNLPADTAIDRNPNLAAGNYNSPLPTATVPSSFDILFTPSGGVIANGVAGTDIHLWLIDTSLNTSAVSTFPASGPAFDGQTLIVTIGLRSGFISVQPPDQVSGDPYSYTRDGKTSGF